MGPQRRPRHHHPRRPPVRCRLAPHLLRHTATTLALVRRADLKGVMDRMGHAQIMTTQKYLHTLADADEKNLAAFDRTLNRGRH